MLPTFTPVLGPLPNLYELGTQRNLTYFEFVDLAGFLGRPTFENPNGALTVFAASNDAFASLHPRIVTWLRDPATEADLFFLLLGHTASGVFPSADLRVRDGTTLTFSNLQARRVSVNPTDELFIDDVKIVETDFSASNGIIHTIDRILNIPKLDEELAVSNSFLFNSISGMGLFASIEAVGGATLFSPGQSAFQSLLAANPVLAQRVFEDDYRLHLYELLSAHVAVGMFFARDLVEGQILNMLNGDTFTVSINVDGISLSSGGNSGLSTLIERDTVTLEAMVHPIDSVLFPSFLQTSVVNVAVELAPTLASLVTMAGLQLQLASTFGLTGT
jgi:uncharacterized surface protein with fasciclin (FAS1) repeats